MIWQIIAFSVVFEKGLDGELSPYNFFHAGKIILNRADGGSYTLNMRGKILEKSRYWLIPYRGSLYEFEGGASQFEDCSAIARLSPDRNHLMAIYGCVKEGYNVEVDGTDIKASGVIVDGDLTNKAAFIFADGVLYIYDLKTSRLLNEYDDISAYGVAKLVCGEEFCLYSDLYENLILFDSQGEVMARMDRNPKDEDFRWKSLFPLFITDGYALVGFEDPKKGAITGLISLEDFSFKWRREVIYVEGDNTACITRNRVILASGDRIYDIGMDGKINYIHLFDAMWVVCNGKYVLTGGVGNNRKVKLLRVD